MVVLLACKNEEDPLKDEGARVLTRLYVVVFFSNAQGQLSQRWNSAEVRTRRSFCGFVLF